MCELILWVSELIPLYFGWLNFYFECLNLYRCTLGVWTYTLGIWTYTSVLWVSELMLWVSALILWASELTCCTLDVWTYTLGVWTYTAVLWVSELILWVSEDQAFWYDPWIWKYWRTKHSGMTCESGNTEGPSILVWLVNLETLKDWNLWASGPCGPWPWNLWTFELGQNLERLGS